MAQPFDRSRAQSKYHVVSGGGQKQNSTEVEVVVVVAVAYNEATMRLSALIKRRQIKGHQGMLGAARAIDWTKAAECGAPWVSCVTFTQTCKCLSSRYVGQRLKGREKASAEWIKHKQVIKLVVVSMLLIDDGDDGWGIVSGPGSGRFTPRWKSPAEVSTI